MQFTVLPECQIIDGDITHLVFVSLKHLLVIACFGIQFHLSYIEEFCFGIVVELISYSGTAFDAGTCL